MARFRELALVMALAQGAAACGAPPADPPLSKDDRYVLRTSQAAVLADVASLGGEVLYAVSADLHAVRLAPDAARTLVTRAGVDGLEIDPRRALLGESAPWGVTAVQAPLPSPTPSATPTKVCVIDSGLDADHFDAPAATGAADWGAGPWSSDGCGHGTHVAGTIAAPQNDLGVVGVEPTHAALHIVRVFGDDCSWTYASGLVAALAECVSAGSRVVNMSLGGDEPSAFEEAAFEQAGVAGLLLVAAAGNDGTDAPSYPASYPSVISVAAVDSTLAPAGFSQHNEAVELAAPGVAVLSTVPGGQFGKWSGTSMAAPHVAGVAAALFARVPTADATAVRAAMQDAALDLDAPGRDAHTGFGLVRAARALELLSAPVPPPPPGECQARGTPCSTDDQCCTGRCIADPEGYDYCL